jgi:selenocysteine lyase/cysteine desulfurase
MIYINENDQGQIDMADLEAKLRLYENRINIKIGVFSASSNVTGILTDTNRITLLLHKYQALAFWDYATGMFINF